MERETIKKKIEKLRKRKKNREQFGVPPMKKLPYPHAPSRLDREK